MPNGSLAPRERDGLEEPGRGGTAAGPAPADASRSEPGAGPGPTKIRPPRDDEIPLLASWLEEEENRKWLDFGPRIETPNAITLKVMIQREFHRLRVFTVDDEPAGVVALGDIDRGCRTATLWYVLGEKRHGGNGHTTRAVDRLLHDAFTELALESVNAWTVESNVPSRRILEALGFELAGRLRRRHLIDGELKDRIFFDLLATDYLKTKDNDDTGGNP